MLDIWVAASFENAICDAPPSIGVCEFYLNSKLSENNVRKYLWTRIKVGVDAFRL